ncbi:MAG: sodium/proton-translocating pyrophosphatase, partial [bacterium]
MGITGLGILVGIISIAYAMILLTLVARKPYGTEKMREISDLIHSGAMAFLKREYLTLIFFIVAVFIALLVAVDYRASIAFLAGAGSSMLAGFIGLKAATRANVRTSQAARQGQSSALIVAFSGGAVMGMAVAGLGVLGVSVFYLLFRGNVQAITGYAMGASSIALFARVGGGIDT